MTNFFDLDVTATAAFHGDVWLDSIGGQVVELKTLLQSMAAGSGAFVPWSASAAFVPAAGGPYLPTSASAGFATAPASGGPYWNGANHPVADLPTPGVITLLTQIVTRVNAISDALVAAGYARYV